MARLLFGITREMIERRQLFSLVRWAGADFLVLGLLLLPLFPPSTHVEAAN